MAKNKAVTLTGPQQVAQLKKLKQEAAAFLLGVTSRSLRDKGTVGRNPDGSYDARELIKVAAHSVGQPTLAPDQLELLLRLEDTFCPDGGMRRVLETFDNEFGDLGMVAVARKLLEICRDPVWPDRPAKELPDDDKQLLEWAREQRQEVRKKQAIDRLDHRTVCFGCGKVRMADKWNRELLGGDVATLSTQCPKCEREEAEL